MPGARARVALTGLTQAEYFRDQSGKDVLFFMDNVFRFIQAGSEVSSLLGRVPSAVGYQPTLAEEMGKPPGANHLDQERFYYFRAGCICASRRLHRPSSSYDLCALGTVPYVLSRQLAAHSVFTQLSIHLSLLPPRLRVAVVGDEHYRVANKVKQVLQRYKDLQDIIANLGIEELSDDDKHRGVPRSKAPSAFSHSHSPLLNHLPALRVRM